MASRKAGTTGQQDQRETQEDCTMLMRFDPFRDFDRLTDQVDQAIRRGASAAMPMDAVRHGDQVFINFDLPGVDPDAIDLTVERDVLTVSAVRRFERGEGDEVLANERPQGTYTRRVLLGESLETDALEAAYDHGVLSITIPVAPQAKPRKVAVGGSQGRTAIEADSHESSSGET
jgi:HSP20 family protein